MDDDAIATMKVGVTLVNARRRQLIATQAIIDGLKDGTNGRLGLDVYEEEGELFIEALSNRVIRDDVFSRLLTFPSVLITGHQGCFTEEALGNLLEQAVILAAGRNLAKLGSVALDGTKVKTFARLREAMSYGRMNREEERLKQGTDAYL